jgi:hypothetical protein
MSRTRALLQRAGLGIGVALALALGLAACSGMRRQDEAQDLEFTLLRYARLMRWGQYAEAAALHRRPPAGEATVEEPPSSEWRVSSFDFGMAQPADLTQAGAPQTYIVPAVMSYYADTSNVVRKTEYLQHWWREPVSGQWFLEDPFPLPASP